MSTSTVTRSAPWSEASLSAARGYRAPGRRRAGRITLHGSRRRPLRPPAPAAGDGGHRGRRGAGAPACRRGACAPPSPRPATCPGPTGESNRLTFAASGPILCLGPGPDAAAAQAAAIRDLGGIAVAAEGHVAPDALQDLAPLSGVVWWGGADEGRALATALAERDGPLVPLITAMPDRAHACHERHVCIDTTAAGGNAALLAEIADG